MNNVASLPLCERPQDYVFNMTTLNSSDAKRLWRAAIKEAWDNRCAYCGGTPIDEKSLTSLTIDHVTPKSKGGQDMTSNCIPACVRCNGAKGSSEWIAWFRMQDFYTIEAEIRIKRWLKDGIVDQYDQDDSEWYDSLINRIAA